MLYNSMEKSEAVAILVRSFEALTSTQKKRLLWHHDNHTPILCGDDAELWELDNGG